jgi:hypothetical protein
MKKDEFIFKKYIDKFSLLFISFKHVLIWLAFKDLIKIRLKNEIAHDWEQK